MFDELIKTWRKYAEAEVLNSWIYVDHLDGDWVCHIDNYDGLSTLQESIKFQAILQGYIQKCISDRKWCWEIFSPSSPENLDYHANVQIHIDGKKRVFQYKNSTALAAILLAYTSTLDYVCGEKK